MVLDNFERHVVRPLQPALFLHVSRERSNHFQEARNRGKVGLTSSAEFEAILTQLRPVGVRLVDDKVLLRSHNLTRRGDTARRVECEWSSCVPLLLRFAGCADDIERFEVERRRQLPWILRTRPDLMWSCELPAFATWPMGREVAWIHRDFMGLYSRGVGMRVLRLVDRIAAGDDCSSSGHGTEPNLCLGAVMDESRAAWCELDAPVYIQRSATRAQRPTWIPESEPDYCPCTMCELKMRWGGPKAAGWKGSVQMAGEHLLPISELSRMVSAIVADAQKLKGLAGAAK